MPALQLPDDVQGPIDFMLVIGTQARVYPAAGYIYVARMHRARVAADMERRHEDDMGGSGKGRQRCWY